MAIKITRKPDLKAMKDNFKRSLVKEMGLVAIDNLEEIKTRTVSQGVDVAGAAFKPYSKGYAAFKSKKTRVSTARVNLSLSGQMIQSLQKDVSISGSKIIARIFPASNLSAQKITWNQKLRKFFAISKSQKEDFNNRLTNIFRSNSR